MRVNAWFYLLAAWLVSLAATLGALFIGEVMGQTPCVLCWYQRIAMFPLVAVLGVALITSERNVFSYAMPLVLVGLGLALFHTLLFFGFIAEAIQPCSAGVSCSGDAMTLFGVFPLPLLSLLAFLAICVFLLLSRRSSNS